MHGGADGDFVYKNNYISKGLSRASVYLSNYFPCMCISMPVLEMAFLKDGSSLEVDLPDFRKCKPN